ncbi:CUB and sushi domain-containing protein 1-like [Oscarella lobularis]|uniref:CUB and sushi domain-containing protein 1-like n=1 Tax=Oscarella lobularis TaxID=121494 RepID=UPI003313F644
MTLGSSGDFSRETFSLRSLFLLVAVTALASCLECDDPGKPLFSHRLGNRFVEGALVAYRCRSGRQLIGNSTIKCVCRGNRCQWDRAPPTKCIQSCEHPCDLLENGSVLVGDHQNFGPGVTIDYKCNSDYYLSGSSRSTCRCFGSSCRWFPPPPKCKPMECPPPGNVTHGHVLGDNYGRNNWIVFQCFNGYRLNGSSRSQCKCDDKGSCSWSKPIPCCIDLACNDPGPLCNGTRRGPTNYTAGGHIEYSCNRGFHMVGSSESTCYCLPHVCHWIPPKPACTKGCRKPRVSPYCHVDDSMGYKPGSILKFRCQNGYFQHGSSHSVCECRGVDCTWSHSPPRCIHLRCRKPPKPRFGHRRGLKYDVGQTVILSCYPQYILRRDSESTCKCTGRKCNWFPPVTDDACIPAACPKPQPLRHGLVHGSLYSVGREVTYECVLPYALGQSAVGVSVCQCDYERRVCEWKPPPPTCKLLVCGKPVVANGDVRGDDWSCGKRVSVQCHRDYRPSHTQWSTCHCYEGLPRWSPVLARCNPTSSSRESYLGGESSTSGDLDCGEAPTVPFSTKEQTGTRTGDVVTYECWYMYRLSGSNRLVCRDGKWDGDVPTCTRD